MTFCMSADYNVCMIRLVATDLDGTLLGTDKVIPAEIFTLVSALKKMGVLFVPSSGRSPYTLYENFRPIAEDVDFICDNGAVALSGGEIIYSRPVPKEIVRDVLEWSRDEDVHVLLCGSQTTYLENVDGTKYEPYVKPYYFRRVSRDELGEVNDDINKIAICDLRNPRSGSYDRLLKMLDGRAAATVSGDVWMDVMQNGIDKGKALTAIQKHRGITADETVAFGDYYNDIPLLKCARYAYVMRNANADMFAYGNRIADSNDEGGVLKVIRTIVDGTFK